MPSHGRNFRAYRALFLFGSADRFDRQAMPEASDKLTPATAEDLVGALAFALRFEGRKRTHSADEIMAEIVARRLVDHLERAGFVVMKRPSISGGAAIGRWFEG